MSERQRCSTFGIPGRGHASGSIVSTPSPKHAPRDIHQPIVAQLVFHMAPNPADIV
ncbi:hypothetical protein FIBSPDRAFT_869630 [Athelia psychrophila]|uniref:Uncharacterized protein n=1 Tax=Athelia psychrophila TaxID=1759441 RepID=A0A166C0K6_9AGAM|nr:hypothetical protein FIBSPDRAFT_869630 [Fibularhizoctonia sp. CBS 109695]